MAELDALDQANGTDRALEREWWCTTWEPSGNHDGCSGFNGTQRDSAIGSSEVRNSNFGIPVTGPIYVALRLRFVSRLEPP